MDEERRMIRNCACSIKKNGMKYICSILLTLILCAACCVIYTDAVYASDEAGDLSGAASGWIRDEAGLLSESEEEELEEKSQQICNEHGISAVIVTTNRYTGSDILDWEETIFAQQKLGAGEHESCLMLGISMAERDWGITAFGDAEEIFGSYSREKIGGEVLDDLSDGDYYGAFDTYLDMADQFMKDAEGGTIYSSSNPYRARINIVYIIIGSFAVSLIVSVIVVVSWKRKMNTKVLQSGAGDYLRRESFRLTERSDIFLYHTVRRTRRQKNENHGSGSMHSSGHGTRGKF